MLRLLFLNFILFGHFSAPPDSVHVLSDPAGVNYGWHIMGECLAVDGWGHWLLINTRGSLRLQRCKCAACVTSLSSPPSSSTLQGITNCCQHWILNYLSQQPCFGDVMIFLFVDLGRNLLMIPPCFGHRAEELCGGSVMLLKYGIAHSSCHL